MAAADFRAALLAFIGSILGSGGEVFSVTGKTAMGVIPVGVAVLKVEGDYATPHVVWFPEASVRNMLELALAFLIEQKKHHKLIIWVPERQWKFHDHLCKYGVIRTVGKYRGYYPSGENAYLFQGVV